MGKPVLRQPVCVQQLENTEHLETFNFHILRPTLRLKRVWSEILNLIARRLPQREIMGHDFDDAMVHWRLVGRNTSWAGQFSSQERNQEPRLILTQCCRHQKPLQQPTCSCKLSRKLGSGYIHQHDEANVIPVYLSPAHLVGCGLVWS